ncbi:hypothetical protein MASR1M32_39650 [Rhodobacter sp.]
MEIALKGLHRVRHRLADGSLRTHYYAWRGGPRIEAAYGTPAFVDAFRAATAGRNRASHHSGTMQALLNDYQQSPDFTGLSDATRKGYQRRIRRIETEYGSLPEAAINSPHIRGEFLGWRDRIAESSGPREADYCFAVLARAISWAHNRRRVLSNPCEKPGRLYTSDRRDSIWLEAEIAAMLEAMSPHVALPFRIALEAGQRECDILRLTWAAYDGASIKLRQSKGGRRLTVPLTEDLRAVLDAAKASRRGLTICETLKGDRWTLDGFKRCSVEPRQRQGSPSAHSTTRAARRWSIWRWPDARCPRSAPSRATA